MLVSRIGDIGIGICPAHDSPQVYTTTIMTGSPDTLVEGQQEAIITSIGCATCGHATTAITGSGSVTTNALGGHRLGDMGINFGPYNMITANSSVEEGE